MRKSTGRYFSLFLFGFGNASIHHTTHYQPILTSCYRCQYNCVILKYNNSFAFSLYLLHAILVNIDDCNGQTCSGHGDCMDGNNTFSCSCDPGFTGTDCDYTSEYNLEQY